MTSKKLPRLTFRRDARMPGLSSFIPPSTRVKSDGKEVGWLQPPTLQSRNELWEVWLYIVRGDSFDTKKVSTVASEDAARQYVKDNWPRLVGMGLRGFGPED